MKTLAWWCVGLFATAPIAATSGFAMAMAVADQPQMVFMMPTASGQLAPGPSDSSYEIAVTESRRIGFSSGHERRNV